MFNFITKWFKKDESKQFLDIDLTPDPILIPNLDKHPVCPKYVSLKSQSIYSEQGEDSAGVFTCESGLLLDYLLAKTSNEQFKDTFVKWLEQRDESVTEIYALSSQTIHKLNLGFFLDELIEHDKEYSVFCPQCNQTYQPQQIKYIQFNGSWVTRHASCPNEHELFSQEIMHIMFKDGAKSILTERVIKEARSG